MIQPRKREREREREIVGLPRLDVGQPYDAILRRESSGPRNNNNNNNNNTNTNNNKHNDNDNNNMNTTTNNNTATSNNSNASACSGSVLLAESLAAPVKRSMRLLSDVKHPVGMSYSWGALPMAT